MPRLTVLMPARNADRTIASSTASVLRAMPKDAELLIWDDASDDGTAEVVHKLRDKRVRIFATSEARGSGPARATLMAESDSEFIACMDADDVCLPWRFSVYDWSRSGADLQFTSMMRFGTRIQQWRLTRPTSMSTDEVRLALLIHNPLAQPTMFARRAAIESAGGYADIRWGQDYELWLRSAAHGCSFARFRTPTIGYRVSATQATSQRDYRATFTSSAPLQRSYWALASQTFPDLGLPDAGPLEAGLADALRSHLTSRIRSTRGGNRSYYLDLLNRDPRLGISKA